MNRMSIIAISIVLATGLVHPLSAEERPYTPVQQNSQYVPPKPKDGFRYPDCFCTDSTGKRIEIGQTTCLQIGSQTFTAQCGMSLNNPTWRRISDGCPSV